MLYCWDFNYRAEACSETTDQLSFGEYDLKQMNINVPFMGKHVSFVC